MTAFEKARWFSLMEGLHQIETYAYHNHIPIKDRDMKPVALTKYIDELTPSMKVLIESEETA